MGKEGQPDEGGLAGVCQGVDWPLGVASRSWRRERGIGVKCGLKNFDLVVGDLERFARPEPGGGQRCSRKSGTGASCQIDAEESSMVEVEIGVPGAGVRGVDAEIGASASTDQGEGASDA